jgi:hypothetical protein
MSDIKKPLPEDDGTDPLTLFNLITAHDARKVGFNWTHQTGLRPKTAEDIFSETPAEVDKVGGFVLDPPTPSLTEAAKKKKTVSNKTKLSKKKPAEPALAPEEAQSPGNTEQPQGPVEANHLNPAIVSSDPQFNPCPAYLQNVCRVDGRPCPYSAMDYKECGKYYLASSGDPELFEITPGREASPEYQLGLKA